MLIHLILPVSELIPPGHNHPIPTYTQLVQECQIHTVNETSMKSVNQMLKVLLMHLLDLKTISDILNVKELELFEYLLRDSDIRMRVEERT